MRSRYFYLVMLMLILSSRVFCKDIFISKSLTANGKKITIALDLDTFYASVLQLVTDNTANTDDASIDIMVKAYKDKRNYDNRINYRAYLK